jgi:diguanylate cyclase (GGDEF)-like protein
LRWTARLWAAAYALRAWATAFALAAATAAALAAPLALTSAGGPVDLMDSGRLYHADADQAFPAGRDGLAALQGRLRPAPQVNIFGGAYWLHAQLRPEAPAAQWVLDPNNTIIERVELRLYGSDGSVQQAITGYRAPHAYAMHYGTPVRLVPGVVYDVLVRFESPYYASAPRIQLSEAAAYQRKVTRENAAVLAALGATAALGVFYFFLFLLARTRAHLYYAGQVLCGGLGWAMTFQLPAELLGWHDLRWHYGFFFFGAAFGCLFCLEFLQLRRHQRWAARAFRVLAALCVLLSPMAVFALPYAHATATLLISAWIGLALVCGVRAWRRGYRPARFFVLAFLALALPASVILPGNLDLIPDLVDNAELLTLVGAVLEALLQAFALADRIRIMTREKDSYLAQLGHALQVAHTDVLTGIGNRFAFGRALQEAQQARRRKEAPPGQLLFAIDLDGLKRVNDSHGHQRGDELIQAVAQGLIALTAPAGACFRLGGDEFAILAPAEDDARLRAGLRAMGFADSGISYGLARWVGDADPQQLMELADRQMYAHKAGRKRERVDGAPGRLAAAPRGG